MIKVKILGVELEADLLNPDVRERYEKCIEKVVEQSEKAKECVKTSEAIRMQCNAVIESLEEMFGEGTAKRVLGEKTNLLVCLDAFEGLCDIYDKYVDPLVNERTLQAKAKASLKAR